MPTPSFDFGPANLDHRRRRRGTGRRLCSNVFHALAGRAAVAAYLLVQVGGGGVATLLQQLVVTPDEQARGKALHRSQTSRPRGPRLTSTRSRSDSYPVTPR